MEAVLRYLDTVDPAAAARVRDRYACFDHFGDDVRNYGMLTVGVSTHHGTVTAASNWEGLAERKRVRPALAGSYEAEFHETEIDPFLLPLPFPAKRSRR